MTWLKSPKVEGNELSWLTEDGSLTERLEKEFDDVAVEVFYEGDCPLDKNFYMREVILKSNDKPMIFARTLVKEDDLEMYGKYKAKLPISLIDQKKVDKNNRLVVWFFTKFNTGPLLEMSNRINVIFASIALRNCKG